MAISPEEGRRRSLNALAEGLKNLPNSLLPADEALSNLVRLVLGMKPGRVYGYLPEQVKPKDLKVSPPPLFWKQTDNYRDGGRTCFSSTMAMFVEFLAPEKLKGDDDYVRTVFSIGDTTKAQVQLKALAHYGIEGIYSESLTFADIDAELEANYPIAVGILHRGPLEDPTGGHWFLIIGKVIIKGIVYYVCNDPYGSLLDGYTSDVENGNGVLYPQSILEKRWMPKGTKGWGMKCRLMKPPTTTPVAVPPAAVTASSVPGNKGRDKAIEFVKAWETCSLSPYLDELPDPPVPTIGWGNTYYLDGTAVSMSDPPLSQSQADNLFAGIFDRVWVRLRATVPGWESLTSGEQAAIASLSYNDGYSFGDRAHDTLDTALRNGVSISSALLLYDKSGGRPVLGLQRRRRGEAAMANDDKMPAKMAYAVGMGFDGN